MNYRRLPLCGWILTVSMVSAFSGLAEVPNKIQADIDQLLAGLEHKWNPQDRIARIAKHGSNAVPFLIETYRRAEAEKRWALVDCLCRIPTTGSLEFVKSILRNHEDRSPTTRAIQRFPLEREDEITLILVDLLQVQNHGSDARERLEQMILRKPSRAGELVYAMQISDKSGTGKNWEIGEVLAAVSGYSHSWCCFGQNGTDWGTFQREFWREWWKRNNEKKPFDWLVETLKSDPRNDGREAQALQRLGYLRDSRAEPYFVKALDDESTGVQYWAVIGLLALEGSLSPGGYRWESFLEERERVIKRLKQKFSTPVKDDSSPGAPTNRAPNR